MTTLSPPDGSPLALTPVKLTDAWVPERLGRRVSAAALRKKALYEILMAHGVQFGRVVQEFSAVPADPQRAPAAVHARRGQQGAAPALSEADR